MKKLPTLFVRTFDKQHKKHIEREVTPGCESILSGEGVATLKFDGSCCALIHGDFYRRYDAKFGKSPPEGSIPCCAPDGITGHWPHWKKVSQDGSEKWYLEAYKNTFIPTVFLKKDIVTFEAVGPHFQGNPYNLEHDILIPHASIILDRVPRDFDGLREYFSSHVIEGIVFWKNGEPFCKIKRSDFGYAWPVPGGVEGLVPWEENRTMTD